MATTWILVANNTLARFFAAESATSLRELADMNHSEARLHDREMTEDLPGKIKNAGGIGGHAFEQPTDPKQHEAQVFAQRIIHYLQDAHNANQFQRLLLIAEPSLLGRLRHNMPAPISNLIAFELDKNLATADIPEILDHLPKVLL